jgi:hypothetical protein
LLAALLEKDFGPSARSGFEATGLYPVSVERATSKLPKELDERQVETSMQRELLKTLNDMRFNPPPTKHAQRPKKMQKLPAGDSYTCTVTSAREQDSEEEEEEEEEEMEEEMEEVDFSDSESDMDSQERSRAVKNIVRKLGKRKRLDEEEYEEESAGDDDDENQGGDQDEDQDKNHDEHQDKKKHGKDQGPSAADHQYPAESFIVAVYQGEWYLGQVMDKEGEPEAEESDSYLLVSFMERMKGDLFKWPSRSDILNVLKDDVLFRCAPPTPGPSTSSSRFNSLVLSKEDLAKARKMFMENQAYYPTKLVAIKFASTSKCGCECVYECVQVPYGVCEYRYLPYCVCDCVCTYYHTYSYRTVRISIPVQFFCVR